MKLRACGVSVLGLCVAALGADAFGGADVPQEDLERIRAAVAQIQAQARPKGPRRVLVFSREIGRIHRSIPQGRLALQLMGEKTGAYTVTCEDDPAVFGDRERLARFDAVVFNNPCFNAVPDSQQRANLLAFIRNGGGFVGIHCAAHVTDWPEYAEMLGGFSIGHPWYSAVVRVEDPRHALTRCFPDPTFAHRGEIYVFNRFSRSKSRVMLSMDTTRAPMHIKGSPGPDADIPLGWVRRYGQGRVFYCALGHDAHSFWDPALLRHYLAGIQYAVGDLAADDMPRPDPAPPAKTTR